MITFTPSGALSYAARETTRRGPGPETTWLRGPALSQPASREQPHQWPPESGITPELNSALPAELRTSKIAAVGLGVAVTQQKITKTVYNWIWGELKSYVFAFFVTPHSLQDLKFSWSGIEPVLSAVEAQSPNHWTTREVPQILTFFSN